MSTGLLFCNFGVKCKTGCTMGCAGMIFYKKALESQINQAVFPGLQGGPHNHTISALATALHMASDPAFKIYQSQVVSNARVLADRCASLPLNVCSQSHNPCSEVHMC